MPYQRSRQRILVVLGLGLSPGVGAAVEGCKPSAPLVSSDGAVATSQPPPVTPPGTIGHLPEPSCVTEYGCVPETASAAADPAPAPYGHCRRVLHADRDGGLVPLAQPFFAAASAMPAGSVQAPDGVQFSDFETDQVRTAAHNAMKAACCYTWKGGCMGGRPLRDAAGDVVMAETRRRDDWASAAAAASTSGMTAALRTQLGAAWVASAREEHSSVASFARLSLVLLSLGAPADLVRAAHEAALDEIEHARAAFGLASAYLGDGVGPGELASTLPALAEVSFASLVTETFVDGCIGETSAAVCAVEAAALARDPVVRRILETIAADEQRHAELAWACVAWALREGGDAARRALARAVDRLELPALAEGDDDLAEHGKPGPARESAFLRRAIAEVVLPCASSLLDAPASPAA
jgi:hypothetical protein